MLVGIHHSADLDGVCCAALFRIRYPKGILIGYDYGDPLFDIHQIPDGATVIMMDVSLPEKEMYKLAARTTLTYIDHHEKKIVDLFGVAKIASEIMWLSGAAILCVCDPTQAACELTMNFLKLENQLSIGGAVTVQNLAMYDIWNRNDLKLWNKQIMPFQFGMRGKVGLDVDKLVRILERSTHSEIDCITEDGRMILQYQKDQDKLKVAQGAFECEIEVLGKRYPAVAINAIGIGVDSFTSVDLKHKILVQFCMQGQNWKVSMRTNGFTNVADLCAVLGGGGHPNAAGVVFRKASFSARKDFGIRFYNEPRGIALTIL